MENQATPNYKVNFNVAAQGVGELTQLLVVLGILPTAVHITEEQYKKLFEQGLSKYFELIPNGTTSI